MESIASALGRIAPVILDEVGRRCRDYTKRGFAHYLGVDPGLISHWQSQKRGMPVEALHHLAVYTGNPEAVYGDLLARVGYRMVPEDVARGDLDDTARALRRAIGRFLIAYADARDPAGPAGVGVSAVEREELLEIARQLRDTARELEASLGAAR